MKPRTLIHYIHSDTSMVTEDVIKIVRRAARSPHSYCLIQAMGCFFPRYFLICIFLLLQRGILGRLVNATIDDQSLSLFYYPEDAWNDSKYPCQKCTAHPDASMAINSTWHDSTFDQDAKISPNEVRRVSTMFNGTAIYVKCILAKTTSSPTGNSDMSFYIDDDLVGQFSHTAPGEPGFEYNVTVYANSSIPPGMHRFTVQNGHVGGSKSLLLFDAFIYSYDDGESDNDISGATTTMSVGTIIGVVVALIVAGVLGITIFLLYRRRRLLLKFGNRHAIREAYRDRRPRVPPSTITPSRTTRAFPSSYHCAPPSTASMSSFVANSCPSMRQGDNWPILDLQRRDHLANTPHNYHTRERGPPDDEEDCDSWSSNGTRLEGSERSVHHEAIER
ncbi:hypothetical protein IW261DRAFT_1509427 [Armillaria novae-zelandiae]|uniref:Uncharacterized protein n=1 Tax=Armillaria novae-zelandiae TaxID=153914 RepID=A0AA39T8U3_9AGAR|nr:hypothetical protein IW261DRAFT_1509427 [Armillaria novae-zelandiae]